MRVGLKLTHVKLYESYFFFINVFEEFVHDMIYEIMQFVICFKLCLLDLLNNGVIELRARPFGRHVRIRSRHKLLHSHYGNSFAI